MIKAKVLTDNASEKITVKWDGTRFAIIQKFKSSSSSRTVILNPREMLDLVQFAYECRFDKERKC